MRRVDVFVLRLLTIEKIYFLTPFLAIRRSEFSSLCYRSTVLILLWVVHVLSYCVSDTLSLPALVEATRSLFLLLRSTALWITSLKSVLFVAYFYLVTPYLSSIILALLGGSICYSARTRKCGRGLSDAKKTRSEIRWNKDDEPQQEACLSIPFLGQ